MNDVLTFTLISSLITERAKVMALEYIVANLMAASNRTTEMPRSITDFTKDTQKLYIEKALIQYNQIPNQILIDACMELLGDN